MACVGFPQCNNQWIPSLYFSQGFNLFNAIGENYQGGILDIQTRITIQFVHRIGALITLIYISSLSFLLIKKIKFSLISKLAGIALLLVCLQFVLGIINVVYLLPLPNAVLHNGVAALLLAVITMLVYLIRKNSHA